MEPNASMFLVLGREGGGGEVNGWIGNILAIQHLEMLDTFLFISKLQRTR